MFEFLFGGNKDLSQNSKKVKRWQAEHKALANTALSVVKNYEENDMKKARKQLEKLQDIALAHLMDEDNTFFKLFDKAKDTKTDQEIVDSIKKFRTSFIDIKSTIFYFFIKYTNPKHELDAVFKEKLDGIINALIKRMEFEENNLYKLIDN